MITIPPRSFCAHCIEEKDDLALANWNGRLVWMCASCRDPAQALAFMAPEQAPLERGGSRARPAPRHA